MLRSTKLKEIVDLLEEGFDIRHGNAKVGICPADFWSHFGPTFPHYVPFPPFWNSKVYPMSLYNESMFFIFILQGITVKRSPQKRF